MAASYAAISAVLKLCFSLEPSLTNPLANLPLPRAMHFASLGNVAPMAAVPSSSSDEAFVEQYFPMTHKKQRAIYFLFHFFSRIALTAAPPRAVFVLTALGGAVRPMCGFGLADAVQADHGRMVNS